MAPWSHVAGPRARVRSPGRRQGGTKAGTRFYSIVVAAYNANGHSIFAIADDGCYMQGECVFDVI